MTTVKFSEPKYRRYDRGDEGVTRDVFIMANSDDATVRQNFHFELPRGPLKREYFDNALLTAKIYMQQQGYTVE
jgi:hypothetical protein